MLVIISIVARALSVTATAVWHYIMLLFCLKKWFCWVPVPYLLT